MNEQTGAGNVTQKFVAESLSLVSSFDESGNVGDHETLSLAITDDPEVRNKSCERIIGDLRPYSGDCRDQSRFPGIGQPDNAHIGQQSELDCQFPFLSGKPGLRITRTPVGRRYEVGISLSTSAAGGKHDLLTGDFQISYEFLRAGIPHDRANRHADHPICAAASMAIFAHPMFAASGFIQLLIAQVEQGRELGIRHRDHVSAASPVSAVWPAPRYKLLTPKANASPAAVSSDNADFDFIDKFHRSVPQSSLPFSGRKKSPERGFFQHAATVIEAVR